MKFDHKKIDISLLFLILLVIVGLPIAIQSYDDHHWQDQIPVGTKEITLTGHTEKGWIEDEIMAYEVVSLGLSSQPFDKPVLKVSKGDHVVLKLKSSDVVHGFSLKDFGIFITDGIQPGKAVLVSFVADKIGTFTFSCNAICGDNHKNMQGTLVVTA
jgi:heme/copper-type cytochrome/quinol oxidase subunit 2